MMSRDDKPRARFNLGMLIVGGGVMLAIGCLGGVAVGIGAGLWLAPRPQGPPPFNIEYSWEGRVDDDVQDIEITVTNDVRTPITIKEIRVFGDFLDSLDVVSLEPAPLQTTRGPRMIRYSYQTQVGVDAQTTFVMAVSCSTPGRHLGALTVTDVEHGTVEVPFYIEGPEE